MLMARLILISLIVVALTATTIAGVSGMVPDQATATVEVYTRDVIPQTDQVTIRVYPAHIKFNNSTTILPMPHPWLLRRQRKGDASYG